MHETGLQNALEEIIQREPIFHHPELGIKRHDFENMTDTEFWEVGASGRRYSREQVLDVVVKRYEDPAYRGIHSPPEDSWKMQDCSCREIARDNYLFTYTLIQAERISRRSTIWRRTRTGWKILYHQGTLAESPMLKPNGHRE